ncbi:hypothetical protein ACNKU7_18585 [Microbulbifer sp. SA54]|uniref:hypothetical protein n=1 Tax=Microbulbifer sp. SA54 TaxID=3401577 RepID=UPI003AAFAB02
MANKKARPFDQLVSSLKRQFSIGDIEESSRFMGGFKGANDFGYENVFLVKTVEDLNPDFLYEIQWGIYESGVISLLDVQNIYLRLYLATIYIYGDRVRPMSGDCDLTSLLIWGKGIVEVGDVNLTSAATKFLGELNLKASLNLASKYCYKLVQILINMSMTAVDQYQILELLEEIESYGLAIEDIVDVSFESPHWIENMLYSIIKPCLELEIWKLYGLRIMKSVETNLDITVAEIKR